MKSILFKTLLAIFIYIFLFFSQFAVLILYADYYDYHLGRLNIGQSFSDLSLCLLVILLWLTAIFVFSGKYLKGRDWLYVYGIPILFFGIFLIYLRL